MKKPFCHKDKSPCPVAHALDIIGDKWTLLIVRDLLFRNLHEYKELLSSFEGISTNILTERLKRLGECGIVASAPYPDNKTRKLYYLTPAGKNLIHTMIEINKWSVETLNSGDQMPPDIKNRMMNDTKNFIKDTLKQLDLWEKENLLKKV